MKKWILYAVFCALGAQCLTAAPQWLTSVPDAQAKAEKEHKLVLLDFTGSDWCVWCKRLDGEILSKPQFAGYASTNLVLVEVDFPIHKTQSDQVKAANTALQSKYNIEGYPTLVLTKPDGTVVWRGGYMEGGPSAMIAALTEVRNK